MQASLDAQKLRSAINALSKCVAKDGTRPIIQFIHIKSLSETELLLEALNGYILLQIRVEASVTEQGEMLLPATIKVPAKAVVVTIKGDMLDYAVNIADHVSIAGKTGRSNDAQYINTTQAVRGKADSDRQITLDTKLLASFAQAAQSAGVRHLTLYVPDKPTLGVLAEAYVKDAQLGSVSGLILPVVPQGYRP